MPSIKAQRRHAKATQRKKILEQRHRLEAQGGGGGLAREVRRAEAAPLRACLVQDSVFQSGVGMVFLSPQDWRGRPRVGWFSGGRLLPRREGRNVPVNWMKARWKSSSTGPPPLPRLAPVDPPYARKLLRDAAAYARSLGLPPHPDYASVELLFGDVAADACDVEFRVRPRRPAVVRSRADRIRHHADPAANRPPATAARRRRFFDVGTAENEIMKEADPAPQNSTRSHSCPGFGPDRNDRRSRQGRGDGAFPGARLQRRHRADKS